MGREIGKGGFSLDDLTDPELDGFDPEIGRFPTPEHVATAEEDGDDDVPEKVPIDEEEV